MMGIALNLLTALRRMDILMVSVVTVCEQGMISHLFVFSLVPFADLL